jgi:crotonobetainyl-CoA:carnitine CoA-transferase CaiB-like acyl-CoA transferase
VQHLGMAVPIAHPKRGQVGIVNQAMALSRTPSVIDRPTPGLGEHTDQVLVDLGYSRDAIADLRRRKVI